MVATISVLSGGASGVARYFSATSGYYDVEQSGVWFGEAADKLNLHGNINRLDFEMVLAGYAPSGDRLAKSPRTESPAAKVKAKVREQNQTQPSKPQGKTDKRERADHVPGYDLCFSAPKSVSSLWAVGSKQVRTDIEVCMREAVRKTLGDVETLLPLGRRGRNGTQQIAAELVTAMFLHTTSRDLDPQLHIHSVIANLCFGEDGRWSSVNSRMLHNWTPALGRVFRCHLASVLMDRMNVQLERPLRPDGKPESWFEVKGVAKEVIEEFSQRRQAIEKATPSEKLSDSHARSRANKETRRKKDPEADVKTLRKQWNERAGRHGLTQESVKKICSHRRTREQLTPEELQKTFDDAIRAVGQEKAHFREWNVVSKVCESLQHRGVDATTVVPQLLKRLHQSPAVVPLDEKPRQGQFSTQKNWQCETALLDDVNELSNTSGAQVSKRTIDKVCKKFQKDRAKPFSDEQSKAVQDLLSDQKSIRVLTGVAGAGKSVTLDAVRLGFERQGYQVIGGALAGTAAAGLKEKTGMPTRTVASYLYHLEKGIPRRLADRARYDARMMIRALRGKRTYKYERVKIPHKSVLIIDEAGMLDTRTMSRLVHHVKEAKATLILVGDTSQLPPIEAGGPLDRMARRLGQARLSTNHRQLDKADAKAASALRAGKVKESLDNYSQRGRLTVTKNHQETIEQVVETWRDQGGTKRPEQHIILTQTRADAHEVNHRCQKERLASKTIPGLGVRHGDTTYYRGDRVMFHVPMRKFGIENGFTGTVLSVNPIRRHVSVRLDNEPPAKRGKKVSRKSKFVTIPLFRMDHAAMSLGYAATTHKLQGATVDHALVLLGGNMLSKELAYTQLTRARKTTRLFASEEQAGKDLELLVKGMSRSVKKDLAHDVKERSGNGFRVQETRQQSNQSLEP